MNYLSHFYLDKHVEEPYFTFGTALPDLHKGFSKIYNRKLRKSDPGQHDNILFQNIHKGVVRHFEVDAVFHESRFFAEYVEIIKRKISDRIPKLQRAYFAAHILLEMLLDRQILLEENTIIDLYYSELEQIDDDIISLFFEHNNIDISSNFFEHFDNFLKLKFLYQYKDPVSLSKAFSRVYTRTIGSKLDSYSFDTLILVIEDMDDILKHKWRNPFNHI